MAPPPKITFSPPQPVRTKEISLLERRYKRAMMRPKVTSATKIIPAIIKILYKSNFNIVIKSQLSFG